MLNDVPKFLPFLFFIFHLVQALILGILLRNDQQDFSQVESFGFFIKKFVLCFSYLMDNLEFQTDSQKGSFHGPKDHHTK